MSREQTARSGSTGLVVGCPYCGCTFRRSADVISHCCAAMQQACEDGPGHDWIDAGGLLDICMNCGAERWSDA